MSYNGYGSIAGLGAGSPFSSPNYLSNSYGAYGAHRDVSGSGGYRYRQWDNGDIAILAGALPSGWTLGQPGPRGAAWTAINAEIGAYPASSSSSSAPTSVTLWKDKDSSQGTARKEEEKGFWDMLTDATECAFDRAKNVFQTPNILQGSGLETSGSGSVAAPDKKVPWGWIIGGTIGVGALITIAVMASKRGK